VLALQAQALAHERFDAAAAAVANHLALTLGCERVSVGLYAGTRLRVVAVSGASDVQVRQNAVKRIAAAMAEALEQRLAIVHPMPPGASPAITLAHHDLAQFNNHAAIYSVPVATRHEVLGALLFERPRGFDVAMLEAARDAAMFAGPLLALQQRAQDGVGSRLGAALRPKSAARLPFGGARAPLAAIATTVGVLALAGVLMLPVTHRVVAPARVEGAVQQVISAPVDGFIGSVAVRPGETVKAGQVLATLDTRELALERDKWAAEASQLDKQYREALSKDEAAPIMIARAKLEQAQSQYELAQRQLDRSTLRAPMDGILLSGDLSQSVGMPAKRGQELMTIAPDRGWRIVAEVEEQSIAPLREGQRAQVLFAAVAGEPLRFAVTRIAPVATQADGQNVFEVEGLPQGDSAALRPGMRGVARIEIGERALGAIWWERAQQAARRLAWRLLG
jgi:RND family efflux transporter MFP subunit